VTGVVNADAFSTALVWENLGDWIFRLILSNSGVVLDEVIFDFTLSINHDQEISSHSNVYNIDFLLLVDWEFSHLVDVIFNLMKENLSFGECSSPLVVHNYLLDSAHVISLSHNLNH
jgi:hypothetical protein